MANKKTGFQYWSIETDRYQDKKIKRLKKEFKGMGVAVHDFILNEIYRDMGCFIMWDESTAFDVAEYWDIKETLLSEIVNYCCHVGLFNTKLLKSESMLSSKGILTRWIDWSTKMKRTSIVIPEKLKFMLEERDEFPEESTHCSTSLPGIKRKEKEITERKEVLAPGVPPEQKIYEEGLKTQTAESNKAGAKKFKAPQLEELKDFFQSTVGNPKNPGHWPPDLCYNEAAKMLDHYSANGWKQGRGKPIIDWQAACRNWIRNKREGAFEPLVAIEKKSNESGLDKLRSEVDPDRKIRNDINFLYESFLDGKEDFTNIDTTHYDFLKQSGLINFQTEVVTAISEKAVNFITENKYELTDKYKLICMKKFGVLEYFKQKQEQEALTA
jgi:hypothetical protein